VPLGCTHLRLNWMDPKADFVREEKFPP